MNTATNTADRAEAYLVTFTYMQKKAARRVKTEGTSRVIACSASEAIGIVAARWTDPAEKWAFVTAKSEAALDAEIELRRQERAYAASRAGQVAAGEAALARIRAERAAKGTP